MPPASAPSTSRPIDSAEPPAASPPVGALAGLLGQRIWLRVRRRRAWLDHLAKATPATTDGAFFNDPDDPARERVWQETGEGRLWAEPIRAVDAALAGTVGQPLQILARTFALSEPEQDLLETCLVQQLDPALGPALAYLNGQTRSAFVSGPVVARLFGHAAQSFWHPLANVRRWQLVHGREVAPGEATALEADPMLVPWLEGTLVLDPSLAASVRRVPLRRPLPSWPLEEATRLLEQALGEGKPLRLVVTGLPGNGRATFAAVAADRLDLACIAVDTRTISEADWDDHFLKVQRFAHLGGFGVIWTGPQAARAWPRRVETAPVQILTTEPGEPITASDGSDLHLTLPPPSIEEKSSLWDQACPDFAAWPSATRAALTQRYQLSVGQIVAIGRMEPRDGAQAIELARESTRAGIGNLGQLLPCPFTWDDMVLPDALRAGLQDLAFEAATRAEFWEQPAARRLFPRGRGLTALLSGTPGTGKTMAAQVIAAELGMDLFRIDLARVVSKYIGETAKHLSEVFSRASRMSAILLFDEADALFAKRTQVKDAHDRHANADTSYLLQLLEEFQGLALLTTNKRGNIDPAFYRRLRYVYDFPKPGPTERLQIWERLITTLFGEPASQALAGALPMLAEAVEISPAQIKNTLLAAAFIARRRGTQPGPNELLKGLERELAKEGRALAGSLRERFA